MTLPPPVFPEEKPDLSQYKKPEKKEEWGTVGCLGALAWLSVAFIVHYQLWGTTEIPADGVLMFLVFDSIVAAVVVGVIAVPLLILWKLWKKFTK